MSGELAPKNVNAPLPWPPSPLKRYGMSSTQIIEGDKIFQGDVTFNTTNNPVANMLSVFEWIVPVKTIKYQNTTGYPQFITCNALCKVDYNGLYLSGQSVIQLNFGPTTNLEYGLEDGIDNVNIELTPTGLHYLRIEGNVSIFLPPNWYWMFNTIVVSDGIEPVWGMWCQGSKASGYPLA